MIQWKDQETFLVRATLGPIDIINRVARVCYCSENPSNMEKQRNFVKKLIDKGHESPLEFVDFIWFLQTNRAIANELVRHRIASYMQESTRYVQMTEPEMIKMDVPPSITMEERLEGIFTQYNSLIKNGTRKENARDLLPLGLITHLYCKMNLREFRHFLSLRLSLNAHPQMRELAAKMLQNVRKAYDFNDYETMFYDIKTS